MYLRRRFCIVILFGLVLASISTSEVCVRAQVLAKRRFYPIADAYVCSDEPLRRHGDDTYLYSQFWDYDYSDDVRQNTYLMFDLSNFSPEDSISSAVLRLYAWSAWSPTANVGVHYCSETSWDEFEITWMNAPSFSHSATDVVAVPNEDEWYAWNVTSLASDALGGKLTLVLTVEDRWDSFTVSFYSKEGFQLEYSPEMLIEYSAEGVDPIVVDGDPSDWLTLGLAPAGTDPPYNIEPYQHDICADLLEAWVHNDSACLYFMIKVRGGYPDEWHTTTFSIMIDTDQDPSTGSPEGYEYTISAADAGGWLSIWNATTLDFEVQKRLSVSAGDLGYIEWCVLLDDIQRQERVTLTFNTIHEHDSCCDGIVNSITLDARVTPEVLSSTSISLSIYAIVTIISIITLLAIVAYKKIRFRRIVLY